MRLLTKEVKMTTTVGDELGEAVKQAIAFSKKYGCNVILNHNGIEHTITEFTDVEAITNNWY